MDRWLGRGSANDTLRAGRLAERWAAVGNSPLVGVAGVGQVETIAFVTIEIIALEIRVLGGVVLWRLVADQNSLDGPPIVALGDDARTEYQVFPELWSGPANELRLETRFSPRPPDSASTLKLDIGPFAVAPSAGQVHFHVALPRESSVATE